MFIKIHDDDNVAVVLKDMPKSGTMNEFIPAGHKVAVGKIEAGADVIKYGYPIGKAATDIVTGDHVHTHNLKTALTGKGEYGYVPVDIKETAQKPAVFSGFERENGVGIRNDIWIIPTVGCVNGIVKMLERETEKLKAGSVGGIIGFTHPYGCSQLGDDEENTRKILAGLITHPNAGGVLVIGLGCENSGIETIKKYLGNYNAGRIKFLNVQDYDDEISAGKKLIEALVKTAADDKRTEISASKLIVGLKCGGSDGFSGITANPVVGAFSDILISMSGTAILTEVPEMFGAERILMNRAENESVFNDIVHLINGYKDYFIQSGMPVYENPSPGNKDGGITTLEEKSLGCTQKSGGSTVRGVTEYGGRVKKNGLNLLAAPGNDLVAATALAAAGAQLILFTTGRGTPFSSPVPTLKISSNSALFRKKSGWIDFNAGEAVNGAAICDIAEELFGFVLETASGRLLKSEKSKLYDMAIFKTGVTL